MLDFRLPCFRFVAPPRFTRPGFTQPTALLTTLVWLVLLATPLASAQHTFTAPETPNTPAAPPNILIVFLDDAGYGDFGCYGHPTIRTPRLDALAAEGMRWTQFYSAFPACSLSRYSLLTGRLPGRSGFPGVLFPSDDRGLHPDEWTIAEAMRSAGYRTGCFGKWHLGHHEQFLPPNHGFDEFLGIPYSNDMLPPRRHRQQTFPPLPLIEGVEMIEGNPDQTRFTRMFTDRAITFMTEAVEADQPFFVYLPHPMPHVPLFTGADHAGRSPRGTYGDVIEEIDTHVGRLLDTLDELGVADDTLVIFTSDNGPWVNYGLEGGTAGLLSGAKGNTYEGGVRVPCIIRWPGVIEPGVVQRRYAMTIDLLPTCLAAAGISVPEGQVLDGVDLLPLLRDGHDVGHHAAETAETAESDQRIGLASYTERPIFFYDRQKNLDAVRVGPWKLYTRNAGGNGILRYEGRAPLLFHLDQDPSENHEVSAEHPEIVERLATLIEAKVREVEADGTAWD